MKIATEKNKTFFANTKTDILSNNLCTQMFWLMKRYLGNNRGLQLSAIDFLPVNGLEPPVTNYDNHDNHDDYDNSLITSDISVMT